MSPQDVGTRQRLLLRDPGSELLRKVLAGYRAEVSPHNVNVTVGFEFQQLGDLDEKQQTFGFAGWLKTEWTDPRLHLSEDELLWLHSVSVLPGTLWDPYVSLIALPSTLKIVSPTGGG